MVLISISKKWQQKCKQQENETNVTLNRNIECVYACKIYYKEIDSQIVALCKCIASHGMLAWYGIGTQPSNEWENRVKMRMCTFALVRAREYGEGQPEMKNG